MGDRPRTLPVSGLYALAVAALAAAAATEPAPGMLAAIGVAALLAGAGATLLAPTAALRAHLGRHATLAGGALAVGGAAALALHADTAVVALLAGGTALAAGIAAGARPAFLQRLGTETRGQTLYEYAAVTCLIAVICVAVVTSIGQITVPWYVISAL